MSEEKCKYCGGEIGYIGMPYGFTCLNKNCITHNDKEFIQELKQQLQTAKEENRLAKQLILHTLDDFGLTNYDWKEDQNEITTELKKIIQQNKQMREALEKIWEKTTFGALNNLYLKSENLTFKELDYLLRPYIQELHNDSAIYKQQALKKGE